MIECVLVGELGPNPALLTEALWALPRQRGLAVRAVYLVTSARGLGALRSEVLAPGAALEDLARVLGEAVPRRDAFQVRVPNDEAGTPLDDERTDDESRRWTELRWEVAREATVAAGSRPVVFALLAGRRRVSSAITAVLFEMLARSRDVLLDVRVDDRRAEGGSGFYFPEQRRAVLTTAGGTLRAAEVGVRLVDVAVPRLRRLLGERTPERWSDALTLGQRTIDQRAAPSLRIELAAGRAYLDEQLLPLTEAQLAWYGALALARTEGANEGWVALNAAETYLRATLEAMRAHRGATWKPATQAFAALLQGEQPCDPEGFAKTRADTRKRLQRYAREQGFERGRTALLVPQVRSHWVDGAKQGEQRLGLDPEFISLSIEPT